MKKSLREQAYEIIHHWIVTGKLPKRQATSELQLSSMLDMSRTPIRSALQQLEHEGYVKIAPKHGVIILDSSAQRVGDLLDLLISLVLFSVTVVWEARHQELIECTTTLSESFQKTEEHNPNDCIQYEFDMLHIFIQLSQNEEMDKLFLQTTSRLFWSNNCKRWKAPNHIETKNTLQQLIHSVPKGVEPFREQLFLYLKILKQTWL
ncbi:GntR family transcriptional regulator [bacterium LRH843]|nr:GntR family transcriptional regulator [bacterium LRH843]